MSDVFAQQNFYNEESLNDEELYDEYIMTRMRMMQGIDIRELRNFFGNEKYL
jgi:coproporphyrinogen III oxidase-like Fe-S oxidoreductase